MAEAIAENAAWYCWHASRRQAMLEACWEKAGAFVHQQIIWVKDRGVLTRSHYLWKHEPCFMGWRRPNRPPKVAEETLPSTWALPSFAKDDRPDHPTPKPLDAFGITPDIVAMMAAEVVAGERAVTRLRPGVELAATVMALRLRDGLLQPADLAAEIDDFAMRAGSRSGQEKAA